MHHPRITGLWVAALLLLIGGGLLRAEPPLPPKPARYFNDYANVVPAADGQRINSKLEQFERETSNQVLVAIFPKIPEGTYLEEYTVKTAESWGPGTKERDNGIILFVFVADRKMRIEVGYGLEGTVPDGIAASIIEQVIKPRFRTNDYAGGIEGGVEAIFQATRGEYEGTGGTLADSGESVGGPSSLLLFLAPLIFFFIVWRSSRKALIQGPHHRRHSSAPWFIGGGGGGGFGGGGGSSFGGGGGFSGGGGSFGGGGASGGW